MEVLVAFSIGLMTTCGIFLLLRSRTFPVVVGLTLLSYAVNLFLFASGGLYPDHSTVVDASAPYADPLPQALVLTAIVIGFAMTAFVVILALRARADLGSDHINGSARMKAQIRKRRSPPVLKTRKKSTKAQKAKENTP